MRPLLIVKTGSALPSAVEERGDYDAWIRAGLGLPGELVRVAEVQAGDALPDPSEISGVVVTGSAAMVSERLPWSERTGAWLVDAVRAGTPVLGLCYGHQLLVHALGGRVGPNPNGREMGTVAVRFEAVAREDPLLREVPAICPFHTTHVESVLTLPEGARRLASTALDPNSAFALLPRPGAPVRAWGIQFHPEFDAPMMRAYLIHRREILAAEGFDPDALLAAVRDTPEGPALLRRFAALVRSDEESVGARGRSEASPTPAPAFTHLVLYDGVCGFCDRMVRWLLDRDRDGTFRFAPLQGDTARALRARHPEIPEEFDTVVFVEAGPDDERVSLRSEAIFRICETLGGGWGRIARLRVLPRGLTDLAYALFARIRYRVFGRLDACRIPSGADRERILE